MFMSEYRISKSVPFLNIISPEAFGIFSSFEKYFLTFHLFLFAKTDLIPKPPCLLNTEELSEVNNDKVSTILTVSKG